MKPRSNPLLAASLASIGLVFSSHSAHAQLYWDSNDTTAGAGTTPTGTWGTDAYWTTDTTGASATGAYVSGSDVLFAAGTDAINAYTVTLNGNQSAVTLKIEEGSSTLSAASATTLSLSGKGSATPWDLPTIDIATGASLSIGNNLAVSLTGTVDHYLAGTGNLTIGGTNASLSTSSTVGLLVINGPTVTVNAGGSINHTSTGGTLLVGAGGTTSKLVVSGGDVNITGSGGLKLANNTGSSGSVELNSGTITAAKVSKGSGTGTIYFDGGTLKASAASTSYWAGSTVNAKVRDGGAVIDTNNFDITISQIFQEDSASTGGGLTKTGLKTLTTDVNHTFTGKVTINGGILSTNKIANAGSDSGLGKGSGANAVVDIGGGGTLRYSGGNVSTDRVVNLLTGGGTVRSDGSGTLTLAGGITGNGGISLRGSKNVTVSGAISIGQANPMVKTDAAIVTLSNAANDFGTLLIAAGTLSVNSIANNGTASALGKGSTDNVASIQLGQSGSNNAGILSFTGASGGSSNRTIRLNNATSGTTGGVGTIENTVSGQLLTLSGGVTVQNAGGTASLTLQGEGNGLLSGNITQNGTLALTKAGNGTWTLSGDNTYSGGTKVSGGTLLVDNTTGSGTGSGAVTVNGGTVGGNGIIAGALIVNTTGVLAPGNSTGLLTVGSLDLNANSSTKLEINGVDRGEASNGYDALNINTAGTLDLDGVLSFTFGNLSAFANNTEFDLFAFDSNITPTGDFIGVTSTGFYAGTWSKTGDIWSLDDEGQTLNFSEVTGNLTIVPEPGAALLGGLGMLALLRRRRTA